MAHIYEYQSPNLEVYANEISSFELKVPHKGQINRVTITQVYGTLDGYTADLYNSRRAAPPTEASASSEETADLDVSLYKVLPTITVTSTNATGTLSNVAYDYRNVDGSYSVPVRRLHLQINPGEPGGPLKIFQISLTIDTGDS